ncbi:MAG: hypothetical protein AABM31_05995 [Actinomycetota bacterium]
MYGPQRSAGAVTMSARLSLPVGAPVPIGSGSGTVKRRQAKLRFRTVKRTRARGVRRHEGRMRFALRRAKRGRYVVVARGRGAPGHKVRTTRRFRLR